MKQSFSRLLLVAGVLVANLVSSSTCPPDGSLEPPLLCGSPNYKLGLEECAAGNVTFPNMPPCCRLHAEQPRKCDDPEAPQACRYVELSSGACPGEEDKDCCFRSEVGMSLYLKWGISTEECCSNCRCYGDPHCEAFDGTPDTWVICDARSPKKGDKTLCPMSEEVCVAQMDHLDRPCVFKQDYDRKRDSIALNGSPCQFAPSPTPPWMSMYKGEDFDIVLIQGERSIIADLVIKDGENEYVLNAELCFQYAYANLEETPWRNQYGPSGVVPTDPDWLPKKWTWSPIDGKDVVWEVTELESMLDLTVRCTRTPERVAGVIKYGPARLNVDIVEPLNWKDPDQRPNISGFCPEGKIAKQGSTANTDMIMALGACEGDSDELEIAIALCGPATTRPGIDDCQLRWCKAHLPPGNGPTEQQKCLNDIDKFGWNRVFCALNVFGAKTCDGSPECLRDAEDCSSDGVCRECVNLIADDGWKAAITQFDNPIVDPSEGQCVTRAELPVDLIGVCQKGVKVQYKDAAGNWITRFAIPADKCVKGDNGEPNQVTITKARDEVLIYNPMRIIQCGEPEGACLSNKCSHEIGFESKIIIDVKPNDIEEVWNLFNSGDLVCNPQIWPTPYACAGYIPEPMCPCP